MTDERAKVSTPTEVAFQKLCRDRFLEEGTPDVPHLVVGRALVRPVSRAVAKRIILKYEWLGTMSASGAHYGIFFGDYCAGACCFTLGGGGMAGSGAHKQYGIDRYELAMLARGACVHWAPRGTNSKLIAWSLRLLTRDYPKQRLVVAYSDSDAGEIGTVYQATNWTFIGRSKNQSKNEIVSPEGRVMNVASLPNYVKRNQSSFSEVLKALEEQGWRQQRGNAKGRYVYVLHRSDRELRERIEALAKPYPKRDDQALRRMGPGPAPPDEVGGSIPTTPLQAVDEGD